LIESSSISPNLTSDALHPQAHPRTPCIRFLPSRCV
jgi:hypothetical protein